MELPPAVSKKLETLLPETLKNDITAFSFVSNMDRSSQVDLLITTKRGEVIEVKDRKIVDTILIDNNVNIKNIILHKTKNSKYMSYILQGVDNIFIVTKDNYSQMTLHKKYSDVANIELDDINMDGKVKVKLWYMDDAIPVVLDDEYCVEVNSRNEVIDLDDEADGLCLLLKEKLAQAKLHTAHSRKVYEEKRHFRQELMNLTENMERFDRDGTKQEDLMAADKLSVGELWTRVHNNKTIIGVPVANPMSGSISDIELILKSNFLPTFLYSTDIYAEDQFNKPPYWIQVTKKTINTFNRIICVATFDTPKFDEFANITINMALKYSINENHLCIPLKDVEIKIIDVVNNKYDPILKNIGEFDNEDLLSIILSSFPEELSIYPIDEETQINMEEFLVNKLKFTLHTDKYSNNVFIHDNSPLNMLHGVIVYISSGLISNSKIIPKLHAFARSENQMLMFMNLIYDQYQTRCAVIPRKIKIEIRDQLLTPNSLKNSDEIMESEDFVVDNLKENPLLELASLLSQQLAAVINHFEKCLEVMSERNISSNCNEPAIIVDVNALGSDKYEALWDFLVTNMDNVQDLISEVK